MPGPGARQQGFLDWTDRATQGWGYLYQQGLGSTLRAEALERPWGEQIIPSM
jgi:hypothetical protein